ncbi:5dbaf238-49fc-4e8e-bcee-5db8c934d7d3 [Sclerotinia trifoliorum]|uniref:5dbaf238-49fc-4e8e-bcee-5db8c934d7d3 n=1 Tax=Sclerotinia trifoliorum TaxID=28548 RepID=A0A8H2VSX1_9HELO|nr:5dbaf238-49fc-4e8e-bcee-5db8c934d7d3 [Sclerotinia trifoliorum]
MISSISVFKKKRSKRDSTTNTNYSLVLGYPSGAERLRQHNGFFQKVKAIAKEVFPKDSTFLAGNDLSVASTYSKGQINGADVEVVQSWDENGRTFARFEDLPMELRLVILELYLEKSRITTLNFVPSDLLRYDHMFGRSFRLTCGSIPPILCLNHQYRATFLERFTKPGMTRSQTTLSIEDALQQLTDEERCTTLQDSLNDGSRSAFPVYATHTGRNIIFNPNDTIWIQGDFWLDELRRSTISRSAFYRLRHLAIPYKTRRKSLFEVGDMLDFVNCIITTFPELKTIALVLGAEEVIPERPVYNGEITFTTPEKVKIVVDVPVETPLTSRKSLSRIWKQALRKSAPLPQIQTQVEHWSAKRLGLDAFRMLDFIKERAIERGNRGFSIFPWTVADEVDIWEIPVVTVVTASLSTASKSRSIPEPTIRLEEW